MKNITPAADENRIRPSIFSSSKHFHSSILYLSYISSLKEKKKKKLENTVMESYVDLPAQRRIGESPQNSES